MVKPLSIVAMGFLVGYVGMSQFANNTTPSKSEFASINKKLNFVMTKQHMLTSVKVQTPTAMPDSDTQEVTLVGYITLHQHVDQPLQWEWILPEGVRVIRGEVKALEEKPVAGKTYLAEITVSGFSKEEKKTISLQGYVETEDSARTGNSFVVSSDPESSFEYIAPELKAEVDAEREVASENTGRFKQQSTTEKRKRIQF